VQGLAGDAELPLPLGDLPGGQQIAVRVVELETLPLGADLTQALEQAEAAEHAGGVGSEPEPGADLRLGDVVHLVVDGRLDPGLAQGKRTGQPDDSTADDCDGHAETFLDRTSGVKRPGLLRPCPRLTEFERAELQRLRRWVRILRCRHSNPPSLRT
jgi:hypothetical protein